MCEEKDMAKRTPRSEARDMATSTEPQLRSDVMDAASMSSAAEPSEQDVRLRAYQRYLERGGGDGRDFDDWVEAERELRNGR
jgi:hypothetical protein